MRGFRWLSIPGAPQLCTSGHDAEQRLKHGRAELRGGFRFNAKCASVLSAHLVSDVLVSCDLVSYRLATRWPFGMTEPGKHSDNPFRIHGIVLRPYFTNREEELKRILDTFRAPTAKLVVYGERRMGKTSALAVALGDYEEEAGIGFMADLSTASTVADMANRVLDAASKALGRRWKDVVTDLVRRIGVGVTLGTDPLTGLPTVNLDVGLRNANVAEQRATLGRVLDSIEHAAEDRDINIAIVLDEFQEIHRFGGEEAEWHLRGAIQHHQRLSYILSGSKPNLVRRMLGKGRAFYGFFDKLPFGAIEPERLASWIDERISEHGMKNPVAGADIVSIAGPRTRDVVRLARRTFELARNTSKVDRKVVDQAFLEVVQEEDDSIRFLWEGLTSHQQNVLRAVSAAETGLTTAESLRRFSLSSSATSQTANKFVKDGVLERGGPSGYRFDSPFTRGWVIINALPDIGVQLPATFQPQQPDDE